MRRYLAIDWDDKDLRVVEADLRAGKWTLLQARTWSESIRPNPMQAEEAGRRLRERLAEAGIAPAPVLFVVGRDQQICREVVYPEVPAHEEPAIVGFQAAKDLSFPAEDAVIDYFPSATPAASGGRRAFVFLLHRDLLQALQKTCQTAGLKLEAVVPSPMGLQANAPDAAQTQATVALGAATSELIVSRGAELLFSRPLTAVTHGNVQNVFSDLRRSLAAYGSQSPQAPVTGVAIAGDVDDVDLRALGQRLHLPVVGYDPFHGQATDAVATGGRGSFAAPLGALQARCAKPGLPINFLQPRKPMPPPNKRRYYVYAAAAIIALAVPMVLGFYLQKAKRTEEIVKLNAEKARLQREITAFGDAQKRLDAIEGWANTEMVLLDELYDLFTHFPDHPGVRITKASWSPAPQPAAPPPSSARAGTATARPVATVKQPERPVGKLVLEASGDATSLDKLRQGLEKGRQRKLDQWEKETPGPGQARFTMKVFRQRSEEYDSVLQPTENVNSTAPTGGENRRRSFPGGRP